MPATNVSWYAPLQRLNPFYPGQFGVPGTDSETGLRLNTEGCIFWVDPNHPDPNDNRDGTNPNAPFRTVAAALTHCEAYRGDTIAVMHNGFWTYGDTTESHITPIQENVTINVPGVRLVGVSSGTLGVPWIPSGNNQTLITVNELDVTIEGFNFWQPGAYTGTTAISAVWDSVNGIYGENLMVRHCYFFQLDYGISLDYTYNVYIEDCSFFGNAAVAIYNLGTHGDPDYLVIRGCLFTDNTADIDLADTNNVLIENNRCFGSTSAIVLDGGSYNQIINNTLDMSGANSVVGIDIRGGSYNQLLGNTIGGDPDNAIIILTGQYNMVLNNAIFADPTGTNNMINGTGGGNNLVGGNFLSCSIAQYDVTCTGVAGSDDSWPANHCTNGDTTAVAA